MSTKRSRWQFKTGKKIKGNGREGEIDLIAWTPYAREEVLLIEYKATMEVAEIHEIGESTKLMLDAQEQLSRCVNILSSLSLSEKKTLFPFVPWQQVKSIYGIVVSSGSNPSGEFDHSQFPAVTRTALLKKLRSNDFKGPKRLWTSCRERAWLSHLDDCEFAYVEFHFGDQSYQLPVLGFFNDPTPDAPGICQNHPTIAVLGDRRHKGRTPEHDSETNSQ